MGIKELLKRIFFSPATVINRITFLRHNVESGTGCVYNGRLRLYGKGHLLVGNNVKINSSYRMNPIGGNTFTSIYIQKGASVHIGDNTGMSNVAIYAAEKVHIGSRVNSAAV